MAILNQKTGSPTFYSGWYGNCESECEDFPLISGTGASSAHVHDNIQAVFAISNNAEGTLVYNGLATIPQLIGTSPIKSLVCGVSYRIIMKPGTGSLDIPHFEFSNIGSDNSKRVSDDCDFNSKPTPSPTPTCASKLTWEVRSANNTWSLRSESADILTETDPLTLCKIE